MSLLSSGLAAAATFLTNRKASKNANKLNQQSQRNSDRDFKLQDDMARSGIRIRTADAKAAGIHPLAALGVPLSSAGGNQAMFNSPQPAELLNTLGQDNSRAVNATRTTVERSTARNEALLTERYSLENDILRSQLRKINASPNPPFPSATDDSRRAIAGQSGSEIQIQPATPTASHRGKPSQEAGAIADYGFTRSGPNSYTVVPSSDIKERIEDQFVPETAWAARHLIGRSLAPKKSKQPPKEWLPSKNHFWDYNPFTMTYTAKKSSRLFGRKTGE